MKSDESPKGKVPKRTAKTAETAFRRLVEGIVTGTIPSGEPLREASIAREWGLSRTPIREAVRRAAEANLVILRRNRAPLVRAITPHDMNCLYEMREVLEILALQQSWNKIPKETVLSLRAMAKEATPLKSEDWVERCLAFDDALHQSWIKNCPNPWLVLSLNRISTLISIFQNVMALDPLIVKKSYKEHCAILKHLGATSMEKGLECLRHHIRSSSKSLEERFGDS